MQLEQFPLQTRMPLSGSNASSSSLSRFSVPVTEDFPRCLLDLAKWTSSCFNTSSSKNVSQWGKTSHGKTNLCQLSYEIAWIKIWYLCIEFWVVFVESGSNFISETIYYRQEDVQSILFFGIIWYTFICSFIKKCFLLRRTVYCGRLCCKVTSNSS